MYVCIYVFSEDQISQIACTCVESEASEDYLHSLTILLQLPSTYEGAAMRMENLLLCTTILSSSFS